MSIVSVYSRPMRKVVLASALLAVLALAGGLRRAARRIALRHGREGLQVVAAENFWGSIAAQLGGDRVARDEHHHATRRPTRTTTSRPPRTRATMAGAQMAIVNGIGYDPWAPQAARRQPVRGRIVLDVGDLVGLDAGDNPHRWYSPADVQQVIDQIAADYERARPRRRGLLRARRRRRSRRAGWREYKRLIATIQRQYAGTPVGASESIFAPLAAGARPEAADARRLPERDQRGHRADRGRQGDVDRRSHAAQIKVWVFNSQNATPDVQRLNDAARKTRHPGRRPSPRR